MTAPTLLLPPMAALGVLLALLAGLWDDLRELGLLLEAVTVALWGTLLGTLFPATYRPRCIRCGDEIQAGGPWCRSCEPGQRQGRG